MVKKVRIVIKKVDTTAKGYLGKGLLRGEKGTD